MPYPQQPYNFGFGQYPYLNNQWQATQQPLNGYIQVAGIDGARAYNMAPNSKAPLFDTNNDVFYDVTTDANGQKTIRTCKFTVEEPDAQKNDIYATKDDVKNISDNVATLNTKFDMMWEALNGKQSISTTSADSANQSYGATNRTI